MLNDSRSQMYSRSPFALCGFWLNVMGNRELQIASIKLSQLPHIMLIKPCTKKRVHLSNASELFPKRPSYQRFTVASVLPFCVHHRLVWRGFFFYCHNRKASNNSSAIVFYRPREGKLRAAAYSIYSLSQHFNLSLHSFSTVNRHC